MKWLGRLRCCRGPAGEQAPLPPPPPYSADDTWSDVWTHPRLVAGHLRVRARNAARVARELSSPPRGLEWATIGRHGGVVWHASPDDATQTYGDLLSGISTLYQQMLLLDRATAEAGEVARKTAQLRAFIAAAASYFGPVTSVEHITPGVFHLVCAYFLPSGKLQRGFAIRGRTVHVPF